MLEADGGTGIVKVRDKGSSAVAGSSSEEGESSNWTRTGEISLKDTVKKLDPAKIAAAWEQTFEKDHNRVH